MRTVLHAYIDVTDKGENLVCHLGLQTVPTHVLVDSSGQVRTKPSPFPLLTWRAYSIGSEGAEPFPPCQHYDTGKSCKLVKGLL